jgi:hypothetical protein
MALPRLHLPGNLAKMIPGIAREFRKAQKIMAVGVEGFAGCE